IDQRRKDVLLGESLGADDITSARMREGGQQAAEYDQRKGDAAGDNARAVARAQPTFNEAEDLIDEKREGGGGGAAEQHKYPVLRLQAGEDVIAEARLPDRGRERRGADHPHGGGADAGHDHGERERKLDYEQ